MFTELYKSGYTNVHMHPLHASTLPPPPLPQERNLNETPPPDGIHVISPPTLPLISHPSSASPTEQKNKEVWE